MNGHAPGWNLAQNPIADAGAAGGGAGVQNNVPRVNISYKGSGFDTVTAMPTSHISSIPEKRRPSIFYDDILNVEDGMGQIPPGETAVNGTFKNQPVSNPQKSIFLTYEAGSNFYHDCKLPLKINIPGGDFGLFKITVNEVLFRNDAPLIDWQDWINFSVKDFNADLLVYLPTAGAPTTQTVHNIFPNNASFNQRFSFSEDFRNITINYLNLQTLNTLLDKLWNDSYPVYNDLISLNNMTLPQFTINGNVYVPTENKTITINSRNIFSHELNYTSGAGIEFSFERGLNNTMKYQSAGQPDLNATITVILKGSFTMTCSDHFRNMFPAFSTVTSIDSSTIPTMTRRAASFQTGIGIRIPWVNFAGPLVFMLNTNAQTTCPIANESASQFKTCALSYNTDTVPQQLVQMTSNIPLILKEGADFRVSLTDMYGNPVKLQSPMYIQVTVSPFSNQAMAELISQM